MFADPFRWISSGLGSIGDLVHSLFEQAKAVVVGCGPGQQEQTRLQAQMGITLTALRAYSSARKHEIEAR